MSRHTPRLPLDPRARQPLRALVSQYVADGQPVGSRALSKTSGLDVSPATIRNVMSDLEELGLIAAPHTSAGRVPTVQGYRVFVDSLLEVAPLGQVQIDELRRELPATATTPDLLNSASSLLSQVTHFVGVVTVPQHQEVPFRHIDFVPLDQRRTLVILVFIDGQVQNRVIELERAYSRSELEQVANFLNAQFSGQRLDEIRLRLAARHAGNQQPDEPAHGHNGRAGPGSVPECAAAGHVRRRPDQPHGRRRDVERRAPAPPVRGVPTRSATSSHLLDHSLKAEGVQIFIGHESGYQVLDDCTIITAPYAAGDSVMGVLGVIGPTAHGLRAGDPDRRHDRANCLGAALNARAGRDNQNPGT